MSQFIKSKAFPVVLSLLVAFICYTVFIIIFSSSVATSVFMWIVEVFLLVFGIGFFLGLYLKKENLWRNCMVVLLIGDVVLSLVQDPVQLFSLNSSIPTNSYVSQLLAGIGGVLAFLSLIFYVLAFSLEENKDLFKKIAEISFFVTAFFYLVSGICDFWNTSNAWYFLGLFTAAFVYVGFGFSISLLSEKPAQA
jgi:hypothetical protein